MPNQRNCGLVSLSNLYQIPSTNRRSQSPVSSQDPSNVVSPPRVPIDSAAGDGSGLGCAPIFTSKRSEILSKLHLSNRLLRSSSCRGRPTCRTSSAALRYIPQLLAALPYLPRRRLLLRPAPRKLSFQPLSLLLQVLHARCSRSFEHPHPEPERVALVLHLRQALLRLSLRSAVRSAPTRPPTPLARRTAHRSPLLGARRSVPRRLARAPTQCPIALQTAQALRIQGMGAGSGSWRGRALLGGCRDVCAAFHFFFLSPLHFFRIVPSADDEDPTRRLAISADKLVAQPFEGIDTVFDILEFVAKKHGRHGPTSR